MTRIIAVAMQKGGVGKTTTTINLAAALAEMGLRVLAVDLDAQCNLTEHAGFNPEQLTPTIYNLFMDEINQGDSQTGRAIHATREGFDLLPSQPELSLVELALMNTLSREQVLATLLEPVAARYDYVLIDCNPSLGLLVINALTAADSVLIPIQTEFLAARGANMLLSTVETIRRKRLNPNLKVEGIVLTMADTRTLLTRDVMRAIEQQFDGRQPILQPVIKRSVRFAESAVAGQSILAYEPQGPGAEAYRLLAREITGHGKKAA